MKKFSFIIPVYNRPEELQELLSTIAEQIISDFEVIVVEDGSDNTSELVCAEFADRMPLQYIVQKNSGPGPARNTGASNANGKWLIFLDSDCLLPSDYIEKVINGIKSAEFDCFGAPDKAHDSFSTIQKAIGYAMSSILTTGGIRGAKKSLDVFYPRSYNLGVKRNVFNLLGGFSDMRFGEDLDFSMRLLEKGYSTQLLNDAYVYHKRRTKFRSFFKQVFNSGMARINLEMRHPNTIKLVHWLPSLFALGYVGIIIIACFFHLWLLLLLVFPVVIFIHAMFSTKEFRTSFLAVVASFIQLFGYGLGFLKAFILRKVLKKGESFSFKRNFYK